MNRLYSLFITLFIIGSISTSGDTQTIRYVKEGGSGNGMSWATASGDIQLMMNQLRGQESQIWIAAGKYKPIYRYDTGGSSPTSRLASFVLRDSITLIGGFPNTGNPGIQDTSWKINKTILSGDIDNNDNLDANGITTSVVGSNSYHILCAVNHDSPLPPRLYGLYITGGKTNSISTSGTINGSRVYTSEGGGIVISGSSPTIKNCEFTGNLGGSNIGAAMAIFPTRLPTSPITFEPNSVTNPIIENCIITNNSGNSVYGTAIAIGGTSPPADNSQIIAPVIRNTIISGNTTTAEGTIYITAENVNALFIDCIISNNRSNDFGAGISVGRTVKGNQTTFVNTLISGNFSSNNSMAEIAAGGVSNNTDFNYPLNFINCTISGNRSNNNGSGGIGSQGLVNLYNCIVYGNSTFDYKKSDGGSIIAGASTLSNNIIGAYYDNSSNNNNIITNMLTSDPKFVNPADPSMAPTSSGNYRLREISPAINYGDNTHIAGYNTDLDHNPRILDDQVDLGSYELQNAGILVLEADTFGLVQNFCFGSVEAYLGLSVIGGTPPYTFEWVKGGNPGIYSTSDLIEHLSPGQYTCTIKDSVGSNQQTIIVGPIVILPDPPAIIATVAVTSNCTGNVFSSSATVNASGGTGALNYEWLPMGGNTETAIDLPPGDYACNVSDQNGCLLVVDVRIKGAVPNSNGILYVEKGKTGNGTNWTNAMGELTDALHYASCATSTVRQIWLAAGIYQPLLDSSFVLKPGIDIIGGFAGDETNLLSVSQLQANLANGDTTILLGNGSAVIRILNFAQTDSLFGCTITGGIGVGTSPNGNGGGIYINGGNNSNPTITNCIIKGNRALGSSNGLGGGIYVNGKIQLLNCIISNNSARYDGGGLYIPFYTSSNVINCVFNNNTAQRNGGAIKGSGVNVINSTIVDNTASTMGGGIDGSASAQIKNSILWSNEPNQISGAASAVYSNIENGYSGIGNLDTLPLFINQSNGDFRLEMTSPCINKGDNVFVPTYISKDIIGQTRILETLVDMGAYEINSEPLPLILIGYSGLVKSEGNLLTWRTTSESNVSHFSILRSQDGKIFKTIGEIHAKNGNDQAYVYFDKIEQSGKYYYRLKINDIDGQEKFSKILLLNRAEQISAIKIFPNPTSEILHLNINDLKLVGSEVLIYNLVSKVVQKEKIQSINQTFHLGYLPKGIYFLQFADGQVFKLFKD